MNISTFPWIFGLQSQPNWLHDLHDVLHLQRLYQKKNTGLQVTGVGHRIKHGMTSLKHGCLWQMQQMVNSEASWENEPDRSTCRTHQDQMLPTTPESEWNWLTRVNFAVMYTARANHDVWRCWRSPWETSVNACYGTMPQQNPIILREVSNLCWHQVFVLFVLRHDVKACRNIFKLVVELFLYCAHRNKLCLQSLYHECLNLAMIAHSASTNCHGCAAGHEVRQAPHALKVLNASQRRGDFSIRLND